MKLARESNDRPVAADAATVAGDTAAAAKVVASEEATDAKKL
jgi:hypothetical protein